jgi:hypothetical protein
MRRVATLRNRFEQSIPVLQAAFGWEDMHLHRFEIRGREYGLSREGGIFFATDARKVRIGDLKLRRMERFTYEYDFGDSWIHDIRIEATLPINPARRYPVCVAGKCSARREPTAPQLCETPLGCITAL